MKETQGLLLSWSAMTVTRWRKAVRQGNCPVRVSWPTRRLPTTPATTWLPSLDTVGSRELELMSRVEEWEMTLARILMTAEMRWRGGAGT